MGEIVFEKQIIEKGGPMSITLTYPIRETHENLALKRSNSRCVLPYSKHSHPRLRMMKKSTNTKLRLLSNDEEAPEK